MLPRAIATALQLPKLEAETFTETQWGTAEEKAKFGNHLLRFIAEDFPASLWSKVFYNRLHLTFSNIAHYNQAGFWSSWFETTTDQIGFLQNIAQYPCWGDPAFTYSDVETAIKARVIKSGVISWKHGILADERKKRDLAELARLKGIYEADTGPPRVAPAIVVDPAMTQTDLFS